MITLFDSMAIEWRQMELLKHVGAMKLKQSQSMDPLFEGNDASVRDHDGGDEDDDGVMAVERSLRELTAQVVELLWALDPFEYFAMVVDGIETHTLAPIDDDDDDGSGSVGGVRALDESMATKQFIPLAGHVAVIASLVDNYRTNNSSDSGSSSRSYHYASDPSLVPRNKGQ